MKVKIWGCRGSMATPGPETLAHRRQHDVRRGDCKTPHASFSTRAPAFELWAPNWPRTGRQKINICLTHLHLDHIEGLGFEPFYDPDCEVSLWGPPSSVRTLKERISRYLSSPLFPIEVGPAGTRDVPRRA